MPLQINRAAANQFLATWTSGDGRVLLRVDSPVDEKKLVEVLTGAGCHLIDIYDALESADPKIPSETVDSMKARLDELIRAGNYKPKG